MSFFGGLQIVKNPCFLDEEKDNCALVSMTYGYIRLFSLTASCSSSSDKDGPVWILLQ